MELQEKIIDKCKCGNLANLLKMNCQEISFEPIKSDVFIIADGGKYKINNCFVCGGKDLIESLLEIKNSLSLCCCGFFHDFIAKHPNLAIEDDDCNDYFFSLKDKNSCSLAMLRSNFCIRCGNAMPKSKCLTFPPVPNKRELNKVNNLLRNIRTVNDVYKSFGTPDATLNIAPPGSLIEILDYLGFSTLGVRFNIYIDGEIGWQLYYKVQ